MKNILQINTREAFREWLSQHGSLEEECWIALKRERPSEGCFVYIDAVEEALCFGWIDSVFKKDEDGTTYQRFSPRQKNSYWTELNKERVRRLIKLGLMTKAGKATLPPLGPRSYTFDEDVVDALKKARAWSTFKTFHPLYQRVRIYNVAFYKTLGEEPYRKALDHLISETKKGHMYGQWNDYGRLLDY